MDVSLFTRFFIKSTSSPILKTPFRLSPYIRHNTSFSLNPSCSSCLSLFPSLSVVSTVNVLSKNYAIQNRQASYNALPILVEKPEDIQRISLNTIHDHKGAKKKKVRVGRGPGSGLGKTSGRGHKGAGQRSGSEKPFTFEGGQTPFYRRIRKYGFRNGAFKRDLEVVKLSKIKQWIEKGRIDPTTPITLKVMKDSGLLTKIKYGVKILASSAYDNENFDWKVSIEASAVSQKAKDLIEKNGGSIRVRHFPRVTLRNHLKFGFTPKYDKHPSYQPHYLSKASLQPPLPIRVHFRNKNYESETQIENDN